MLVRVEEPFHLETRSRHQVLKRRWQVRLAAGAERVDSVVTMQIGVIEIDENEIVALQDRLRDGPVEISGEKVVRLTLAWIRQQTPAAVVRFGEGEGRLLVADEEDALSMRVAARKLRRQTGLDFSPGDVLTVKSHVMNALDQADIVGIRRSKKVSDEMKMWVKRIEREFEGRLAHGRPSAYVSHHLIGSSLADSLATLLEGQRQVSVISCRDVEPVLRAEYGVEDVKVYQIPSQYIMRRVDGEYEAAMHDVPIWPDFYRRLRADLSVRKPGEVFLVGAGLLGKDLCIRVKELGGIALDLGSRLDRMAGKTTRGRNKPEPFSTPASRSRSRLWWSSMLRRWGRHSIRP